MDLYQPISATTSSQISSQPSAPLGNTIIPKQTVPVLPPTPAPTITAPIKGSSVSKTLVSLPSVAPPPLASTIKNAVINSAILPTATFVNPIAPNFLPLNASSISEKSPLLNVSTIICDYIQAGVEISTALISLDQAFLTANNTELLLNGIPLATTSNLSSLSDWALDPAISTIDANLNDIINVKNIYASDFIGNLLNINQAFISDLTVYQQTTENFASTITLDGRTINCSTINVNDTVVSDDGIFSTLTVGTFNTSNLSSVNVRATNITGSNVIVSSINGEQFINGNAETWSRYPAVSTVQMNGYNIVSGNGNQMSLATDTTMTIVSSNGDISIVAPNDNLLTNYAVNVRGGDLNLKASEGARIDLFSDVNITAENGNRGRVNITANGGFSNGVNGEVNIVANGGTNPLLGVGAGGVVNITANTPIGFSNLTSAIKLNASGIDIYAGFVPPIGSVAGYNFIYGLGGNVISAGNPPIFPSVPGTNYIWGEFGTTIANDLYTDRILPNFTIAGQDLTIRGRTLPYSAGVRLSNVKSIYMDSPGLISNVGSNYGNLLSYTNGGFNSLLTNFAIIGQLTPLPSPFNSFISGFCNISGYNLTASNQLTGSNIYASNIFTTNINGSPYVPGGGGIVSTLQTASISSLTVSSINNYVSLVSDSNSQGFIVKGDVPAILLQNTDITSQQTGLLLIADDNASIIQSFNTSNANQVNMLFKADNFGFNIDNITGGIEVDISGNTQIQNGSLYVSSIVGLQTINGTEQFVFGEFLATISQTVGGVNTPTTILLDTTNVANGMRESGGLVQVDNTGLYEYTISIQLDKSGGSTDFCDFWITVNGNAVANTGSQITVQGTNGECLANCQYFLSLNANDVVGIVFASPDNTMTATYFPAWTTPVDPYDRPAIPAVIAQMKLLK